MVQIYGYNNSLMCDLRFFKVQNLYNKIISHKNDVLKK